MSVIVADAVARQKALAVEQMLNDMAAICDELARTLDGVTMPGGGLSSAKMRQSLDNRKEEALLFSESLGKLAVSVNRETALYLRDIDHIDSFLY